MMCDVMPTISESGSNDRESQSSQDEANFEQLMVNMLDERDKLMETLRETQDSLTLTQQKLADVEKERDTLQGQFQTTTPQVFVLWGQRVAYFMMQHTLTSSVEDSE